MFAGVLGLLLLFSACSGGDEEVARVGDTVFHLSDIRELFDTGTVPIDEDFLVALNMLVVNEIFGGAFEDQFGLVVDDAAVEEVYTGMVLEIAGMGISTEEAMQVTGAGDGLVHLNAELVVLQGFVADVEAALLVEPETLAAAFGLPALVTNVCARHILVETEDEADDVIERLGDGEDFAVVSEEVSLDEGAVAQGGDLGCGFAARYVEEFAAATLEAEIDEFFGPVETEFGFHVLVVYERTETTEEEYLADPLASVDTVFADRVFANWVDEIYLTADVEVMERFGTWNGFEVVAAAS